MAKEPTKRLIRSERMWFKTTPEGRAAIEQTAHQEDRSVSDTCRLLIAEAINHRAGKR